MKPPLEITYIACNPSKNINKLAIEQLRCMIKEYNEVVKLNWNMTYPSKDLFKLFRKIASNTKKSVKLAIGRNHVVYKLTRQVHDSVDDICAVKHLTPNQTAQLKKNIEYAIQCLPSRISKLQHQLNKYPPLTRSTSRTSRTRRTRSTKRTKSKTSKTR